MNQRSYIDIHCHILPRVDDGAQNMKQTKNMLRMAAEQGVSDIIATPHFKSGQHNEDIEIVQIKLQEVRQWLEEQNVPLQLHLGNEVLCNYEVDKLLEDGIVSSLAGSRYVLIEFMPKENYSHIVAGVRKVLYAGYIPVIAHAERYEAICEHEEYLEELIEIGAYIQVNASSVIKKSGFLQKHQVRHWIKQGWVQLIASDAHDEVHRVPNLLQAAEVLRKLVGEEVVERMLYENPRSILEDKIIRVG